MTTEPVTTEPTRDEKIAGLRQLIEFLAYDPDDGSEPIPIPRLANVILPRDPRVLARFVAGLDDLGWEEATSPEYGTIRRGFLGGIKLEVFVEAKRVADRTEAPLEPRPAMWSPLSPAEARRLEREERIADARAVLAEEGADGLGDDERALLEEEGVDPDDPSETDSGNLAIDAAVERDQARRHGHELDR